MFPRTPNAVMVMGTARLMPCALVLHSAAPAMETLAQWVWSSRCSVTHDMFPACSDEFRLKNTEMAELSVEAMSDGPRASLKTTGNYLMLGLAAAGSILTTG